MNKLLATAMLCAVLSPSLQAQPVDSGIQTNEPLSYFDDANGARFAWNRANGWTLVAPPVESPTLTERADDAPLAVFTDLPSGFRFVWTREGQWVFVGNTEVAALR